MVSKITIDRVNTANAAILVGKFNMNFKFSLVRPH